MEQWGCEEASALQREHSGILSQTEGGNQKFALRNAAEIRHFIFCTQSEN